MKLFIILGAINGFLAVALGAFGAHGLEGKISDHYLNVWQKGCAISNVPCWGSNSSRLARAKNLGFTD